VHNPQPAEGLRVLGSAALPPGSEPDPAGAVQLSPAVAQRLGAGSGPAPRGVDSAVRVPGKGTPRDRWEAAVAARPLESPRPLPSVFHSMASAITGRARAPLFTTGPATRHALAAAGALGATTGTVVHLPATPSPAPAVAAVLAHELTHTRSPVRRPRFLLGGMSGLLDDDERSALSAGRDALSAGRGALSGGREQLVNAGRQQLSEAAPMAAGIVDQLPVGGGIGAVGDVATRAARAAVLEAAASPIASMSSLANNASGVVNNASGAATGALNSANGLMSSATSTAAGAVDAATGAVSSLVSSATGDADKSTPLDADQVVEIVEARLSREIERRGGRWAGVF